MTDNKHVNETAAPIATVIDKGLFDLYNSPFY